MRVRRFISSLLLAIYTVAGFGGMLSVILCHCERSQHFQSHHAQHSCCHSCHSCHHSEGEGIKSPSTCGCHHDHSTEIDLYNYEELQLASFTPVVCSALPAMQEHISLYAGVTVIKLFDCRKIPLPVAEFVALKGLRAPPVIA